MTCSSMAESSVRSPEVVVVDAVAEIQGFHTADKLSPVIVDLRIDSTEVRTVYGILSVPVKVMP